jgi:DNA polymerase-3 subunit beta
LKSRSRHLPSCGGEGDGAVTVGARKLQEILRSLPDATEVSLVLEDKRLQVRAGKSKFSLQTCRQMIFRG